MWHLKNFTDSQLIDIAKNYEIYKYDISVKFEALAILKTRGILEEDLKLVGNPKGELLARRKGVLRDFKVRSRTTLVFYTALVIMYFFVNSYPTLIIYAVLYITYLVFLILSFLSHKEFYKVIDQPDSATNAIVFILLGKPFYPLYYPYLLKDMKENI